MKLYTRTGDTGQTSLIGGRVEKHHIQVEAFGTIDELNAFVGSTRSQLRTDSRLVDLDDLLERIQHELFDCGSDLCYAHPSADQLKVRADMAAHLEGWIDRLSAEAPPIKRFILPGGAAAASSLHLCRTVCRRAERRVAELSSVKEMNPAVLTYLNRLSDLFFAAARAANFRMGEADTEYVRGADVFRGDS